MKRLRILLAVMTLTVPAWGAPGGNLTPPAPRTQTYPVVYIPGSVQKLCQVAGDTDLEFNQPTVSLTETRYGLVRADHGYSFEHHGKTFFLFGDSHPSPKFNGKPNKQTDLPRVIEANDAIGYSSDSLAGPCLKLDFVTDSIGAYKNPVVLDAQGKMAVKLMTNESPISGISDGGRMYVIFGTGNPIDTVSPPEPLGHPSRTVLAVSDDDGSTFHFLYNFSREPDAKFIGTAIARASDGYLYFWGTQSDTLYRKSAPFLARKPVGSMADSTAIEYLHGINPGGTPVFMAGEANATPIFHDSLADAGGMMQVADGMSTLGVEWNQFVQRWVMLYNCNNDTPANPRGIYMRTAPQPWGPWSAPQTIFNPVRDHGLCYFIHRAVGPPPLNPTPCDSLCGPDRLTDPGGNYGPFFISRFTTGNMATATSTFYFTMDTWNPYTEVVMTASIQGTPAAGVSGTDPASPLSYTLEQNYPNPFNPGTDIKYQISAFAHVRLSVFDILGREVALLVDENRGPGSYTVRFNASGLSSGSYFYRLEAGDFVSTRTMLLVR